MKIRKKTSLLFVSLFVSAFLIIGITTVLIVKNNITQLIFNNLKSISSIQLTRIESINAQNTERLNLISSRTQLRISLNDYNNKPQESSQQKMNVILEDARLSVADFDQISILNLEGEIIASTVVALIGEKTDVNDTVFKLSQKENISNIYRLNEKSDLRIHMYGPLVYNTKTIGLIHIIASSEKIQNFISDYSGLGSSGYTRVLFIDKYTGINPIVSPRRGDSVFQFKQLGSSEQGQISEYTVNKKTGVFQNITDSKQELMFASIEYSEDLNLGLSVRMSEEEVFTPLRRLIYILIAVIAVMISLLIIVINYSTKLISEPIERLTKEADLISKGNLDQKIKVSSKDEVGLLAMSLNTMVANLRQSIYDRNINISEREKAEAETKESQKHFETLFNFGADAVFVHPYTESGFRNFVEVNRIACNLFGYSREEFLELSPIDIASQTDAKKRGDKKERAKLEEVKNKVFEATMIKKSGEVFPVEISSTVFDYQGQKVIMSVVRDITERKQIEKALHIEKEFSERIINTSTAIIIGLDKNHLIQIFNKGAETATGYTEAEMIGKDWFKIFFPEELLEEMNKVWKDAWGIQSHPYENPIRIKTGEKRMVSWQSTGFYEGEDSTKHLLISIGEDITERKQAEIELQNSKAYIQTIFDSTTDAIFIHDSETGIILDVNQRMCEMFGYEKNEVLEQGVQVFSRGQSPYSEKESLQWLAKSKKEGKQTFLWRSRHKEGYLFWTEVSLVFVQLGGEARFIATVRDVDNRKKIEEELEKYRENLEELVKERTQDIEYKNIKLERTNKAFVGRELRMKELKKEIERLKGN